jgi:hypothetical protein
VGPAGPSGSDGAPGVSGYEIVTATTHSNNLGSGLVISAQARCPSGKKVIAGGGRSVNSLLYLTLTSSYPDPATQSWIAETRNSGMFSGGASDVTAYAICANVQ